MRLSVSLAVLYCGFFSPGSAQSLKSVSKTSREVTINLVSGILTIRPLASNAVRIRFHDGKIAEKESLILTSNPVVPKFKLIRNMDIVAVRLPKMQVEFSGKTTSLIFKDAQGKVILSEEAGSRLFRSSQTDDERCYQIQQSFLSPKDEHIYGLGQFQDGHFDLHGLPRKLVQVNSQVAIPVIYSNKGYGLLWHQYGLTDFNAASDSIALTEVKQSSSDTVKKEVVMLDGFQRAATGQKELKGSFNVPVNGSYVFMLDFGGMESIHYMELDGKPVIHQKNRWLPPAVSKRLNLIAGQHTIRIVCQNSSRPTLMWRPDHDRTTFYSPHAEALDYVVFAGRADEVIASFRNLSGQSPLLPKWAYGFWQCRERYNTQQEWLDVVNEFRSRKIPIDVLVQDWQYWGKYGWGAMKFDEQRYPDPAAAIKQLNKDNIHLSLSVWENVDKTSELGKEYLSKNYYVPGSRWIDLSNPAVQRGHWSAMNKNIYSLGFESWWLDATEPPNDALTGKKTFLGPGDKNRLTYPLFASQAVYEGQRLTNPDGRVCILTRSGFPGIQRYGSIIWSGDVGGDWDAYQRQIPAGLNYSITGLPYWTSDIGGFFRPGKSQYTDVDFHELLIRWFQFGSFSPIMRIHGNATETELWKFGPVVEAAGRKMLSLRYRLLPYIYSQAWQVSKHGSSFLRPLVMDFPSDPKIADLKYQYLFGSSFLVAPVTLPQARSLDVYLPSGASWYDFWTGKPYSGGQTTTANAALDILPLFVRAGSIVPLGPEMQYATESKADTISLQIYPGANGAFELYEDESANTNYEKGKYSLIPITWNNAQRSLTIGKRIGAFKGMLKERTFVITDPTGKELSRIIYKGNAQKINIEEYKVLRK